MSQLLISNHYLPGTEINTLSVNFPSYQLAVLHGFRDDQVLVIPIAKWNARTWKEEKNIADIANTKLVQLLIKLR